MLKKNLDGKLEKYLRSRDIISQDIGCDCYTNAPIGWQFDTDRMDPVFKETLEARIAELRKKHPGVDLRLRVVAPKN
ncbi:hypothetical protein [Streptomyces rubradiris]|uniref:Uncharacterized protein n=1 Tax=Streptomyces rubradiris TaxID=285531 RepID=A0ABQ3RBN0_STRRR|nr:hypothetical protein [Streptomyces rubradiris]GHI53258.1 hypothetical protein Srubr_31040 [Streptomyces rubradiris]